MELGQHQNCTRVRTDAQEMLPHKKLVFDKFNYNHNQLKRIKKKKKLLYTASISGSSYTYLQRIDTRLKS